MFAPLFPGVEAADVPITHVTNGVHAETWTGPEFGALYRARLGDGYGTRTDGWERLASVTDEDLLAARTRARARLVDEVRRRLARQSEERGDDPRDLAWQAAALDPRALTIGFARRVPTYKRLTLLLHQRERLKRILTSTERPVQLLVAGKAHPHDSEGKQLIEEFGAFAAGHDVRHRVVMLADYDMALANVLVSGVDVWLNTPLRPLEACGTSGMKAALNGVLNLSILDGWWDECYAPAFGWAIPSADEAGLDADARDTSGGRLDPRPDRARARAPLLRARRRSPARVARNDSPHDLRARPGAARDAHGARLRAAALPSRGRGGGSRRGCTLTLRGRGPTRAVHETPSRSRGRGYNRRRPHEEAR